MKDAVSDDDDQCLYGDQWRPDIVEDNRSLRTRVCVPGGVFVCWLLPGKTNIFNKAGNLINQPKLFYHES